MEHNETDQLAILTEIFANAGAKDPELWASSEINEGIPQLARFSFLKAITSELLKDDDLNWVDRQLEFKYREHNDPGSQIVNALEEMIGKNVSRESIIDLIRVIQFETLSHVCNTIDLSYQADTPIDSWVLFQVDDENNPIVEISSLHESLLEFDPSGNEIRPRIK